MQRVQRVQREEQGNQTYNPEPPGARKLERSTESHVEEAELDFKVDLRIERIAQDVILKDEERIGKSKKDWGKVRNGSRTKSILEDLGKPETL